MMVHCYRMLDLLHHRPVTLFEGCLIHLVHMQFRYGRFLMIVLCHYYLQNVQACYWDDYDLHVQLCQWMLGILVHCQSLHILFTREAQFTWDGMTNAQNL